MVYILHTKNNSEESESHAYHPLWCGPSLKGCIGQKCAGKGSKNCAGKGSMIRKRLTTTAMGICFINEEVKFSC